MRQFKVRIRTVLSYSLTLLLIAACPFVATSADATTGPTSSQTTTTVVVPTVSKPDTTLGPTSKPGPTSQPGPTSKPGPTSQPGPTSTPSPIVTATTTPSPSVPTVTPITSTATTNPNLPNVTDPSGTVGSNGVTAQSASGLSGSANSSSNTTGTTNNNIGNTIGSVTQSGNAAVSSNTLAGNASSGNASATTTLMNTVNSTVAAGTGGVASFVANITGNVYGDIMLYPMILGAMLSQAVTPATNASVNTTTNNQIANNVNLNATSGGATVANNTTAGNATSGTANAVADVVNIINSIVSANKSFIGTINIYGNLNGDILVAPGFIPQLLASNAAAGTATDTGLNANVTNNQAITNNVNLIATSGAATVAANTQAGNATTGSAGTNLVILNLTGHDIVASNSLLVFVNVLGKWVGLIVDAPTGATAAAIGSGVNQNSTAASTNGTIAAQTNSQITNNINLAAQSGNASVTKNTTAGNATSGNATSSANILNLSQTSLGLSGWFGILFINVFGSWLGSFGIDTAQGNTQPPTATATTTTPQAGQPLQAIRFIDKTPGGVVTSGQPNLLPVGDVGNTIIQSPSTDNSGGQPLILGASSSTPTSGTPLSSTHGLSVTVASIMGAIVLLAFGVRRLWPVFYRRFGGLLAS